VDAVLLSRERDVWRGDGDLVCLFGAMLDHTAVAIAATSAPSC
jgi:hypothetical protein